jgi:hypothetical protein
MKGVASLFFFLQPLISFFFLLMAVARAKGGRCVAMAGRGAGARVAPSLASSLLADVSRAGQVGAASRFSPCKRGMGAKRGSTMRARDWRGVRFRTLPLDGCVRCDAGTEHLTCGPTVEIFAGCVDVYMAIVFHPNTGIN